MIVFFYKGETPLLLDETSHSIGDLASAPIANLPRANTPTSRFANYSALEEIYRVLKPIGLLGMIWNIEDCEQHTAPLHPTQENRP